MTGTRSRVAKTVLNTEELVIDVEGRLVTPGTHEVHIDPRTREVVVGLTRQRQQARELVEQEGFRYDDDTVEEAYNLWAWVLNRHKSTVADHMGVPQRTIHRWIMKYRWHERYQSEVSTLSPKRLKQMTALHMHTAAPVAAEYLVSLIQPDTVIVDAKAEDIRVKVAFGILNRTGWPEQTGTVTTNEFQGAMDQEADSRKPIRDMTPDEILEELRKLADGNVAKEEDKVTVQQNVKAIRAYS